MSLAVFPTWLTKHELHNEPDWLQTARANYWHLFMQQGLPTRKHERWKYADLTFLTNKEFFAAEFNIDSISNTLNKIHLSNSIQLVCVNGEFIAALSEIDKLPKEVIVCNLKTALHQYANQCRSHWQISTKSSFANLSMAQAEHGFVLIVPEQCHIEQPIHLVSIAAGTNEFIAHAQQIIIIGANSKLSIFEEECSLTKVPYILNTVTSVDLHEEASYSRYKLQRVSKQGTHLSHTFIQQQKNSLSNIIDFSLDGLFIRNETIASLQAVNAICRMRGFAHAEEQSYIASHIDINHCASHTQSEMLFKNIINHKARVIFNGKLNVEKAAQKITAYQGNHNLLLSNEAEVYSKPELEIYADDVKCKHGATTGQLDTDALFYLQSRGIDRDVAEHMLLQGFANEILQCIGHEGIKSYIGNSI